MNREEAMAALEKEIVSFLAAHPDWERCSPESRMLIHTREDRWTLSMAPCETNESPVDDPDYRLFATGVFKAGPFGDYKIRVQSYTLEGAFKLLCVRVREELEVIQASLDAVTG